MAKFDPPVLTRSPLSGRVYVITHGKVTDPEKGQIEATVKYDVTKQFDALVDAVNLAHRTLGKAAGVDEGG